MLQQPSITYGKIVSTVGLGFLAVALIILAAMLCPAPFVLAQKSYIPDMEEAIRAKELERLTREYKKNLTFEDELYEYEKSDRISSEDYQFYSDYVSRRQDIMPLTFGDRYYSNVFWVDKAFHDRSMRDRLLPDWMLSEKYLEQRRAGTHTERVGPADDAAVDEVRAAYGERPGMPGWVMFKGYEKFDHRTKIWYPAEEKKNYDTGKMEYDYPPVVKSLIMENIRRVTIRRFGPEKYKQLTEHARQRSPEYKIEQFMQQVRAQAKVYDKQQKRFVPQDSAKEEAPPSQHQSDKERQKEMERKAQAQQRREAEGQTRKAFIRPTGRTSTSGEVQNWSSKKSPPVSGKGSSSWGGAPPPNPAKGKSGVPYSKPTGRTSTSNEVKR